MSGEKKLIVIGGPTGSGKTKLAIALAQRFSAEIISADSRQFYQEMQIGTARPTSDELAAAKHHFVGHLSIDQPYSVGDFERDALALLDQIYTKHDVAILVGGSSLYIKALCEGLDKFPPVPPAFRDAVEEDFMKDGLAPLLLELQNNDPDYFAKVDQANPARIKRAVSFNRAHGEPFSSYHAGEKPKRPFTPIYLTPYHSRSALYERIDQRVDQMMELGLLAEVQQLLPNEKLNALNTVGYAELFAHLHGELDLAAAVALIQQNSRRYAKRQLTWMRKEAHWRRLADGNSQMASQFLELIQQGWQWNSGKNEGGESFRFFKSDNGLEMNWLKVYKKSLGLLKEQGEGMELLWPHLADQAKALAEDQPYWIMADQSAEHTLLQAGWKTCPTEYWMSNAFPDMDLSAHQVWEKENKDF